jgi:photosystem II stability/assembly factor-like uncharacterized protein
VCSACGGETPAPVVVPKITASATPPQPPRTGAKWYFPSPASGIKDKLDLEGGSMLLVGDLGRREIVKNGEATDSAFVIPGKVIGVWRDDQKHFVVGTHEGDTYTFTDPLGQFEVRKGPGNDKVKVAMTTTGKASATVVMSDGSLLRTADNGQSWKPVDVGPKTFGHFTDIDIDHFGNGFMLRVPQRVYVTHDDGATWKPIASPAMGVRGAADDVGGSFFVRGWSKWMKLSGDALVATDDQPTLLSTLAVAAPPESERHVETTRVIAGDKVIEIERRTEGNKSNKVRVRATPLGTTPGQFAAAADLASTRSFDGLVAAWGASVVALRIDEDADENNATSTIVTSNDGGATWKAGLQLEGDDPFPREAVAAGPKGWAFIPSMCGNSGEEHERNCTPAKIRVAGSQAFEDLLFTEQFQPRRFAFDEAHDKVYVVGLTEGGSPTLYESKLSQNKFTRISKPIKTSYHEHTRITVTADGTLHVFRWDSDKSALSIERRDVSGKEMATLYVPSQVEVGSDLQGLAVLGSRALVVSGKAYGWETNDGGQTWSRVAANGADQAPDCGEAGCLVGDAQRVGWDLPLAANAAAVETVKATTDAPTDNATPDDPREDITSAPPRMTITCKATGPMTKLASRPLLGDINEGRDIYWVLEDTDKAGKKTLSIGGKTGIRHETLIEAPQTGGPKDLVRTTAERMLPDGVVAARYTRTGSSPIDIELSAFSLETGKMQHVTIPKVPSFRVASYGLAGDVQILGSGLLYQTTDASQAYWMHDGKTERVTLPARAQLRNALRTGNTWMLLQSDGYLALSDASTDNGASWQERSWLVTDSQQAAVNFVRGVGGRPWVSTAIREGSLLYPIKTPPSTEPEPPVVTDLNATDVACDPKAYAPTYPKPTHGDTVHTTVDLGDKKPPVAINVSERLTRVTADGKYCTAGFMLDGNRVSATLFRDAKGMFGWAFQTAEDWRSRNAVPLTCTVSP